MRPVPGGRLVQGFLVGRAAGSPLGRAGRAGMLA